MDDDSTRKAATANTFGESADGYLHSRTHSEGADLELLASWCDDATRALDVATGAGHTAGALLGVGISDVVAADASPSMIATSIDSFPGVRGVVADAERLPFGTDSFEVVTCRIAAHHFPDPEAFVREVSRVLAPGGVFALEDNVAPEDDDLDSFINRLETLRDPTHGRSHRTSDWHAWIAAAGLSVEETTHLRKRIEVDPWIDRIGAHDAESERRIRRHLRDASEEAATSFDIEYDSENGDARAFDSLKALIRAEVPGEHTG